MPHLFANKNHKLAAWNQLPRFGVVRCENSTTFPILQWYEPRDGPFDQWDERMKSLTTALQAIPSGRRKPMAVFRGAFQPFSLYDVDGEPVITAITKQNYKMLHRTKLRAMADEHPIHLDVRIFDIEQWIKESPWDDEGHELSMEEQVKQFKYIVVVEGHCGWADRLKVLLHSGAAVLLQETYCHEYYRLLLKPWVHYIPVRGDLGDLIERIDWAREHDGEVLEIARNAQRLAQEILTQQQMTCWSDLLLTRYARLYR